MPMNAALVGKTYPPARVGVTAEATMRYARAYNARPVLPGETITTQVCPPGTRNGRRAFDFETQNPAGAPVITGGVAEIGG